MARVRFNPHVESEMRDLEICRLPVFAYAHDHLVQERTLVDIVFRTNAGHGPDRSNRHSYPQQEGAQFAGNSKLRFDHRSAGAQVSQPLSAARAPGHHCSEQVKTESVNDSQHISNCGRRHSASVAGSHHADSDERLAERGAHTRLQQTAVCEEDQGIEGPDDQKGSDREAQLCALNFSKAHENPGIDHGKPAEQKDAVQHKRRESVSKFCRPRRSGRARSILRRCGEAWPRLLDSGFLQHVLPGRNIPTTRRTVLGACSNLPVTMRTFHSFDRVCRTPDTLLVLVACYDPNRVSFCGLRSPIRSAGLSIFLRAFSDEKIQSPRSLRTSAEDAEIFLPAGPRYSAYARQGTRESITEGQAAGISGVKLPLRAPIRAYTFVILVRRQPGDTLAWPGSLPCFPALRSSQTAAAAPARC